jgi:hypothetical protein
LTETNPTRKNTFRLQRLHGSRIGRVFVHVDQLRTSENGYEP